MILRKIYHPYKVKKFKPVEKSKFAGRYFLFASRETTQTRDEIWMSWLCDHGLKTVVHFPCGQTHEYFVDEKSWLDMHKRLAKYIVNNWDTHYKRYFVLKSRLLKVTEELARMLTKKPATKSIIKKYSDYTQDAYDFSEYIMGAWSVITYIEPEVIKYFPGEIGTVNSLEKPIEFIKMQHECLKLSPKKLAKKYGWLNMYNPTERPFDKKYFENLKAKVNKREVEKQLAVFKANATRFGALFRTIADKKLKTKILTVHTYAFLKTDRVDVWKKSLSNLLPFYRHLQALAPGFSLSDVCNLSVQEVLSLLQNNSLPTKAEISFRSLNQSVIIYGNHELYFDHDPKRIREANKFLHFAGLKPKEFNGVAASGGKAEGRAVVVMQSTDLAKVKNGQIMIAKFTLPTYTAFMAKCKAVVTDEGGITSHAAVVSRELGVPCIVNAKIATEVIKDGDMVEVDADKGVVRVIKRK